MSSTRNRPLALNSLPVAPFALLAALTLVPLVPASASAGFIGPRGCMDVDDHLRLVNEVRERFQYALIQRGSQSMCFDGGRDEGRTIERLEDEVHRSGRGVLWFAIGRHQYVVRDTATVARADEILEPVSRLGAEQGRLGGMQGELGRRQGELGQLQGEVGQVQAHLASLEARGDDRHRAELDALRQELHELSAQVWALSVRQRELGAQQQELGRRQRELGEQQARASRLAFDQLRSLADKAIASGTAESADSL